MISPLLQCTFALELPQQPLWRAHERLLAVEQNRLCHACCVAVAYTNIVVKKVIKKLYRCSGAGTNLKVCVWGGQTSGAERRKIFVVPLHFFGSTSRLRLVVLASAFVMVSIQFGKFLVCCSSTHGAPRAQYRVGAGVQMMPMLTLQPAQQST